MAAIEVRNVEKHFKVFLDKGDSLKEKILFASRRRYENRTVLDGVSFDIEPGQAVGLVGHNGCGKSTLLKLMTRILYPDSGTIKVNGRVSSLIELGAGFHPDMSGRENIYTNASIFGLSKAEIDARLEDIITFSELEEFIDNPVRTYSSGMYMRLAFSVAINVDADVLLIDEILAVGDANFQSKCFNKLQEIKKNGTTIVIVSHSLAQVEQICDRSIWIHKGKIMADGKPRDVHPQYLDLMAELRLERAAVEEAKKRKQAEEDHKKLHEQRVKEEIEIRKKTELERLAVENARKEQTDSKRWGEKNAEITEVEMLNEAVIKVGAPLKFKLHYKVNNPVEDAVIGFGIFRADGTYVYGTNTRIDGYEKFDLKEDGEYTIEIPEFWCLPGQYVVDFALEHGIGNPEDYWTRVLKFGVYASYEGEQGTVRLPHNWSFSDKGIKIDEMNQEALRKNSDV